MEVATRSHRKLRETIDLGEFTLLLPEETVESGAKLAAEVRAAIVSRFMRFNPVLSLFYDLDIEEADVVSGSRRSKNKPRLKRKKGRTFGQKIFNAMTVVGLTVGLLSADYENIPTNLEKACKQVVSKCQLRGQNVQIIDLNFQSVRPDDT